MIKYEGYDIPLTLNFGRRIGTASIVSVDDDTVTITCEVSPEVAAVITELTSLRPLSEISLVIREIHPETT